MTYDMLVTLIIGTCAAALGIAGGLLDRRAQQREIEEQEFAAMLAEYEARRAPYMPLIEAGRLFQAAFADLAVSMQQVADGFGDLIPIGFLTWWDTYEQREDETPLEWWHRMIQLRKDW